MTKEEKYQNWDKEELIEEILSISRRKKFGLVWEHKVEDIVDQCKTNFSILREDKKKEILNDPNQSFNYIIEGDNYEALSTLSYTHKQKIDVIYIDPPYNTGAKDWKYNNDFVEEEDSYRHSKWLSMMHSRLEIAKKLLSEKGVLICTIDKHEQARLALLLEEIFTNYEIVCVTIIHNPAGTQGKNFSYSNEFAYFVFPKNGTYINKTIREDPLESAFRDWGTISLRNQAKTCFYPIIVKDEKIIGFGDVCDDNFHPKSSNIKKKDGSIFVYPIKDNEERKWVFSRGSVDGIQSELFCKLDGKEVTIHRKKYEASYKTVWDDKKYYANIHGSSLLNSIIENDFPFPKSIYATKDCLKAVKHPKDATILDFFAGSGTTGHAVMLMNEEDKGNRKFILCTNNENNISRDVTYPRIRNVINGYKDLKKGNKVAGLGGNLKYFKTDQMPWNETDGGKKDLVDNLLETICFKEQAFELIKSSKGFKFYKGVSHNFGILLDDLFITDFSQFIKNRTEKFNVYAFSFCFDDYSEEFKDIDNINKIISIPDSFLEITKSRHKI